MKILFAVFDEMRSEMFTDTFETGPGIPVPIIGDVIKVRKAQWLRITGRKIAYDDGALPPHELLASLHSSPGE